MHEKKKLGRIGRKELCFDKKIKKIKQCSDFGTSKFYQII
jgi:hypothetical protein